MSFFKNPKDVHITGSRITNVEGNQVIHFGRDKRTEQARFGLPKRNPYLLWSLLIPLGSDLKTSCKHP